jgi:hypothetical protein
MVFSLPSAHPTNIVYTIGRENSYQPNVENYRKRYCVQNSENAPIQHASLLLALNKVIGGCLQGITRPFYFFEASCQYGVNSSFWSKSIEMDFGKIRTLTPDDEQTFQSVGICFDTDNACPSVDKLLSS